VDRSSDSGSGDDLKERCCARVEELTAISTESLAPNVARTLDEIMESELMDG
jgi:hypothetical protein